LRDKNSAAVSSHTALAADEALLGLRLPAARPGERFAICEIARRQGDYALAGAAIADCATGRRIAVFGVAERACLSPAAAVIAAADPAAPAIAFADALAADIDFVGDHEHPAAFLHAGNALVPNLCKATARAAGRYAGRRNAAAVPVTGNSRTKIARRLPTVPSPMATNL
jgi:hypothetical protein